MTDQNPTPQESQPTGGQDKSVKDTALIAMLLNLLLPLFTGFLAVGIGGLVFSKYDEKYKSRGLTQLLVSIGGFALFFCLTFGTLGFGIIISWIFMIAPIAMYIWSILDAVEIYQNYYS